MLVQKDYFDCNSLPRSALLQTPLLQTPLLHSAVLLGRTLTSHFHTLGHTHFDVQTHYLLLIGPQSSHPGFLALLTSHILIIHGEILLGINLKALNYDFLLHFHILLLHGKLLLRGKRLLHSKFLIHALSQILGGLLLFGKTLGQTRSQSCFTLTSLLLLGFHKPHLIFGKVLISMRNVNLAFRILSLLFEKCGLHFRKNPTELEVNLCRGVILTSGLDLY